MRYVIVNLHALRYTEEPLHNGLAAIDARSKIFSRFVLVPTSIYPRCHLESRIVSDRLSRRPEADRVL